MLRWQKKSPRYGLKSFSNCAPAARIARKRCAFSPKQANEIRLSRGTNFRPRSGQRAGNTVAANEPHVRFSRKSPREVLIMRASLVVHGMIAAALVLAL